MCWNRWDWVSEGYDSRLQSQLCCLGELRGMEKRAVEKRMKRRGKERERRGEKGERKYERREEEEEGGRGELPPFLKHTMFRVSTSSQFSDDVTFMIFTEPWEALPGDQLKLACEMVL